MYCTNCGKEITDREARYCLFCGKEIAESGNNTVPLQGIEERCPWEEMEKLGFLNAFIDTLALSITKPSRFFKTLSQKRSFKSAIYYGLIVGSFGYVMSVLWNIVFGRFLYRFSILRGYDNFTNASDGISVFFAPAIILAGIFIGGMFLHLFLMLVGGNKKGFKATLTVVCYSISANVFCIIPFLGSLISMVLGFALTVIGLREVHGISTTRAVFAFLLPFIAILGLVFIGVLLLLALVPSLIKEFNNGFLEILSSNTK
jgi:hypothetical protein